MTQPWLRHYPIGLGASLDYPSIPLYRLLQDSARRFPSRVAIISFDGESGRETAAKSYRALDDESSRLAAALAELGVGKGDRVAYYLQNSPSLVVSFYAILKAGAVPVPCNPMYQADELTHQLSDCGASTIVCDAQSLLSGGAGAGAHRVGAGGGCGCGRCPAPCLQHERLDSAAPPAGTPI